VISEGIPWYLPIDFRRLKRIPHAYPDEARSFYGARKIRNPEKENREKSNASTGDIG